MSGTRTQVEIASDCPAVIPNLCALSLNACNHAASSDVNALMLTLLLNFTMRSATSHVLHHLVAAIVFFQPAHLCRGKTLCATQRRSRGCITCTCRCNRTVRPSTESVQRECQRLSVCPWHSHKRVQVIARLLRLRHVTQWTCGTGDAL